MVRLNEWFHHLTALIKRIEAEKGSERVVAQIGSDSFPAFVNGTQILEFAASRGILLLASPPYTQKLNPVEGFIKILVRVALAMLRQAGAPRTLVEFALVQATMMLNRLPRARKGERSAYVLCALPHFNISYSAHVTFNEEEFPLRETYQPDSAPSSLFEPGTSRVGQESVGGDWGRVLETPGGPGELRTTLAGEPGARRRPMVVERPAMSSWTASAGAPNVLSHTTPADEPRVLSNTTFQRGPDVLSRPTGA